MEWSAIRDGELYTYRAKKGPRYSRYEGKKVRVRRKSDRKTRLVMIEFIDGPRRGETRMLTPDELEPTS